MSSDATQWEPSGGDTAWLLASSALVMLMTPGLAFFYAGLARSKSALNLMMQIFCALIVVTIQWFVLGYSLCFSSSNAFIGGVSKAFFRNTGMDSSHEELAGSVPEVAFAAFQCMFAILCPALITGATAERFAFPTYLVFLVVWSTIIYDPLAHMTWHPEGFLNHGGSRALDFAGGLVVHVSSGVSALVASLMLGPRKPKQKDKKAQFPPHSPVFVTLGCALLWFGWFGFNAGSALSAGSQAAGAFLTTQAATAAAGGAWAIAESFTKRHVTATGVCTGVVAGLVVITPACGFVRVWASVVMGILGGLLSFAGVLFRIKSNWYDDALDVFGCHGLAGALGALLTGVFADNSLSYTSGLPGGWVNAHWAQMEWQAIGLVLAIAYAGVGTAVILYVLDKIMGLRVTEQVETAGLDNHIHGERMYQFGKDVLASHGGAETTQNTENTPGRAWSPCNDVDDDRPIGLYMVESEREQAIEMGRVVSFAPLRIKY